jgi:hypothetical protein
MARGRIMNSAAHFFTDAAPGRIMVFVFSGRNLHFHGTENVQLPR